MAVLPIVEIPDPRLRLVSKPVDTVDDVVRTLIDDMIDTMYDASGIGLAAIQVGVDKRVLIIDLQEEEDADGRPIRNPRAFVNPEILSVSDETRVYNEGCLSIPEQYAEVERPERCQVRWFDRDGTSHEEEMGGLLATCLQHEMDHLNGVLFVDHISRLKREMLLKKLDKNRKAGV
jgi:peptide deformylase